MISCEATGGFFGVGHRYGPRIACIRKMRLPDCEIKMSEPLPTKEKPRHMAGALR
jgi:hypothetical protein